MSCSPVVLLEQQSLQAVITLQWRRLQTRFLMPAGAGAGAGAAVCRTIGAQVLIDDNVGYAMECANAGIDVLLYDWEGSYPWSKLPEG
jgi:hypothetical protein